MSWDLEYTDEFDRWLYGDPGAPASEGLEEAELDAIAAVLGVLEEHGPALGRPLVDQIKSSRNSMKELRVPRHDIRILFAWDPRRTGILLIGGSKTNRWSEWYREFVPIADALYDEYLKELEVEGLL